MDAESSQQDISGGSVILGEAGAGRTSVESLRSDVTPPVLTSNLVGTPPRSDGDDILDDLYKFYTANQQTIKYVQVSNA